MIVFANPWVLWALLLAVVPLVLHLWPRPVDPPAIAFGATRFLAAAAHRVARRVRRREWLLLALRTLLLILIVLAFARPGPHHPESRITQRGSTQRLAVGIVASSRHYLEAALGPTSSHGESRLIFLDEKSVLPGDETWVRLAGIQTGGVTVAAGPYFQPALAVFDQPGHGDLRRVRTWRWWKLEPRGAAIVLARFSNGDPFLVEHWSATGKTILCAVPADLAWSDLPLHPNFVPLAQELVRYLAVPPPATAVAGTTAAPGTAGPDLSRWLLGLALVLAAGEMILSGIAVLKLAAGVAILVMLVHPVFSWRGPRPRPAPLVIVADHTDSMRFREGALARLLAKMPPGEMVTLTGNETALGDALLGLTNRAAAGVILLSDGQHNQGVSPVWVAAAWRVPVFAVAVGDPWPPRDVAVAALAASELVFAGEEVVVRAFIASAGYDRSALPVMIERDGQVVLATNVPPGEMTLRFGLPGLRAGDTTRNPPLPPPAEGNEGELRRVYTLRVAPRPGEATTANNARPFALTVVPEKIKVHLAHAVADWEFRHVRHALERDPAVELVAAPADADVVIATTNQTWRLQGRDDDVFQRYWSECVRAAFLRARHLAPPSLPVVAEELYALGRNDRLLAEVARVSGGRFFTAATIADLPAALLTSRPSGSRPFDLRDSGLALLAVTAAFIISWALRRLFSGTA